MDGQRVCREPGALTAPAAACALSPRSPLAPREAPWHPAHTHMAGTLPPELDQQQAWACVSGGPRVRRPGAPAGGPGQQPPAPALGRPLGPLPSSSAEGTAQGHRDLRELSPTALLRPCPCGWASASSPLPVPSSLPAPAPTRPGGPQLPGCPPRRSAPGRKRLRVPMTLVVIFTSSGARVQLPACRLPGVPWASWAHVSVTETPPRLAAPSSPHVPPCPPIQNHPLLSFPSGPASAHQGVS